MDVENVYFKVYSILKQLQAISSTEAKQLLVYHVWLLSSFHFVGCKLFIFTTSLDFLISPTAFNNNSLRWFWQLIKLKQ